jgi:diguanylate cyclase (GGDEF)-like protein
MRLGLKFTLLVVVILSVTLGATSIVFMAAERSAARAQLVEKSRAQARLLTLIAPDAMIGYNYILLNEYAEQLTRDPDLVYVAVFDLHGRPVTSYVDPENARIHEARESNPDAAVAELPAALGRLPDMLVERMPITSDKRPLGELVIAIDLSRIDRELMMVLVRQVAAYLAIIFLLSAAIVAVFRFNVLRPVRALMRGARRVSSGDYVQQVEVFGSDELGTLTDAFNAMMAEIKEEREQLFLQAHFDALTGLPNRKMAMDRIAHEIERARREETTFAILFLDLDNFKFINDTMGHAVGDKVLIQMGQRLKDQVRSVDLLARLGGDEYLVLMPHSAMPEEVHAAAQRLVEASAKAVRVDESDVYTRCSVGIAFYPMDGDDAETLMAAADSAMYSAKHSPTSSVQFYTPAMNEAARKRVEFERDIYTALERNEFFLVFQPIVRAGDFGYVGAETLLRWQHPKKGLLAPGEFIAIAEQTGQIDAIGDWVMRAACYEAGRLMGKGIDFGYLAVNVSSNQLKRGFPERVEGLLRQYGLGNDRVVLEITESTLLDNNPDLLAMFSYWRDTRMRVALDDFGTGFSSLSYLSRFSFNTIKIDKSFVDGLPRNLESRSVVAAIIAIAQNLGMETLAEGVEREEQRAALVELGAGYMQGYLHRRPMPMEEFEKYLGLRAATDTTAWRKESGAGQR